MTSTFIAYLNVKNLWGKLGTEKGNWLYLAKWGKWFGLEIQIMKSDHGLFVCTKYKYYEHGGGNMEPL